MNYTLRPVADADYNFLWDLHVRAMKAAVEKMWGWDEAFQKANFRAHFSTANAYVIMVGDNPAGELIYTYDADSKNLFLATIEILPQYQRKGLGTAIIQALVAQAKATHGEVRLQVLKTNPDARRLYERLGFEGDGETKSHDLLRFSAIPG